MRLVYPVPGVKYMGKPASEALKRAIKKYDANNTKQYHLKLNLKSDADIIEHLCKQDKVQSYIKRLIRKDMAGE